MKRTLRESFYVRLDTQTEWHLKLLPISSIHDTTADIKTEKMARLSPTILSCVISNMPNIKPQCLKG
uniref:Uncharacterized protein n=1 Tax=Cucumis melo TaxID=3656 RepID=A0A9I9ELX3_CUCME